MNRGGYDADIRALQIVVAIWLVFMVARALHQVARGDQRTIHFVQLVNFFFCGLPLILDIVVTPPRYPYHWGFIVSQYDRPTNFVYLLLLAWVPIGLTLFAGKARAPHDGGNALRLTWWARAVAAMSLLAVIAVIALAPNPSMYLEYAASIDPRYKAHEDYQSLVSVVSSLAIVGGMILLAAQNSSPADRVATVPLLFLALWVNGKRSLVCLALMLLLYLLWMRGTLRGTRLVAAMVAAAISFGTFSYLYQTRVRDVGDERRQLVSMDQSDLYVNYRIDFGRDAVIKQTIFAELHPEKMSVLEYRGQSLLFYVTFFVPRSLWQEKPYPYSVYATTAMLRMPPHFLYWGITTSWLEEAIANFGWLGLVLGPLVPARICAMGDRRRTGLLAPLTLTVSSLLLVVQLAAFLPLFLLWVGIYLYPRRRGARGPRALEPVQP